jgi:hypothetical protein
VEVSCLTASSPTPVQPPGQVLTRLSSSAGCRLAVLVAGHSPAAARSTPLLALMSSPDMLDNPLDFDTDGSCAVLGGAASCWGC